MVNGNSYVQGTTDLILASERREINLSVSSDISRVYNHGYNMGQ